MSDFKSTPEYQVALLDQYFDGLEKAKPDSPLFDTTFGENWLEAKRTIRAYFNEILEKTL